MTTAARLEIAPSKHEVNLSAKTQQALWKRLDRIQGHLTRRTAAGVP